MVKFEMVLTWWTALTGALLYFSTGAKMQTKDSTKDETYVSRSEESSVSLERKRFHMWILIIWAACISPAIRGYQWGSEKFVLIHLSASLGFVFISFFVFFLFLFYILPPRS
jgi:hypothetical protein